LIIKVKLSLIITAKLFLIISLFFTIVFLGRTNVFL
jgi:hypothetical protein